MAGELERLLIRLEADTSLLRKELDAADKKIGAFGDSIDRQLSRSERRFSSFASTSGRILSGIAVGYLVKETAQLADTYTNMANRLKFVTSSAEELASVQARLFQIAQETRQDLAGVTELYSRMAFALRDTGASQEQLLKFTENLNKALALSGASGSEASGALIQLSQGLASGTLRGQELNSVLEQTPYLAALIAKQMGVTTGELRKLGEQGKITGANVFNAIAGASDELDRKFSQTVPTVSQGFVTLANSLLNFVGEVSVATEAGRGLAWVLQQMADAVDRLAYYVPKVSSALRLMMPEGSTGQDALGMPTMKDALNVLGHRATITSEDGSASQPLQSKAVDQFTQVEKQLEQLRIQALEAQNLQTEALQAQHALELQNWQSMLDQKLISLEQFNAASANLQIVANRRQIDAQSKLSDALLSQISATGSAAFGENKKWAIAEAAISTYQGVAKALGAYPPPYNFAMAALVAAQGFAQVAAIRSTSAGSSGGGASVSSGASTSSAANASSSYSSGSSSNGPSNTIAVTLVGETYSREQVRKLIEGFNDAIADGARLYVK